MGEPRLTLRRPSRARAEPAAAAPAAEPLGGGRAGGQQRRDGGAPAGPGGGVPPRAAEGVPHGAAPGGLQPHGAGHGRHQRLGVRPHRRYVTHGQTDGAAAIPLMHYGGGRNLFYTC